MTTYPVEFHRRLGQKWASRIDQILSGIGNTTPPRDHPNDDDDEDEEEEDEEEEDDDEDDEDEDDEDQREPPVVREPDED